MINATAQIKTSGRKVPMNTAKKKTSSSPSLQEAEKEFFGAKALS